MDAKGLLLRSLKVLENEIAKLEDTATLTEEQSERLITYVRVLNQTAGKDLGECEVEEFSDSEIDAEITKLMKAKKSAKCTRKTKAPVT